MRKVLLGIFILCSFVFLSFKKGAENDKVGFASRKLKEMARQLPLYEMPSCDTIVEVSEIIKDKALVFVYHDKQIVHIGVSMFSRETKEIIGRDICNFLERYFLELLLLDSEANVNRKLKEDHVTLLLNGKRYGEGQFHSIGDVLQSMSMPVSFSLSHQGQYAEAVWSSAGRLLQMRFPLYRELIVGMDKKESDEGVYNLLKVAEFDSVPYTEEKISRECLEFKADKVYVRHGESFIIKTLTSDRYYVEENGNFHLIFQPQYPEYSMNNLFLSYQNGVGKTLKITHRQYGHFTPDFSIPLNNFLACFKDDFIVVCHTGYNKQNELETIVVFSHKVLNYIHLLRVHIDAKQLFTDHPVLKADFYSNIPQHYINSLLK